MKIDVAENIAGFENMVHGRMQELNANGLNTLAFAARKAVQAEMRSVFRDPEPLTLKSVMVKMADPTQPIGKQFAEVYIRDDVAGASTQPAKYLLTEESGGPRAAKRSERALQNAGILQGSQQFTPGPGALLDSHGQLMGSGITRLLSRISAFHEMGFSANASARTKAGLRKKGLAVTSSGTDFFLPRSKLSDGFMGVFQLVSKGKIKPVLWFTMKTQTYRVRFPFRVIVAKAAAENFQSSYAKAARYVSRSKG